MGHWGLSVHGLHFPVVEFLNDPTWHLPWHGSPSTHGWHFNAAATSVGAMGLKPGLHLPMQLSMFSSPALVNVALSLPIVQETHRGGSFLTKHRVESRYVPTGHVMFWHGTHKGG
jgi:hypothetical protein